MATLNSICDNEFTAFLQSLGVETFNKSFEWMLSDTEFGEVLRWIYSYCDQRNALSAREECRYAQILKQGDILSSEELDIALLSIQKKYSGICLPGDSESTAYVTRDISAMNERAAMLERQERILKDLTRENEIQKEELDIEVVKLNVAQHHAQEDDSTLAQKCLQLANKVETSTNNLLDSVADTLHVFATCYDDKAAAKIFLWSGPIESYRQLQALFGSHLDMFAARRFNRTGDDEEALQEVLAEARDMEGRILNSVNAYIESMAELRQEEAKIAVINNYSRVPLSQVSSCLLEIQIATKIMEREKSILQLELATASQELVARRTTLAINAANSSSRMLREKILEDLALLTMAARRAISAERLAYGALRREERGVRDLLHLAGELRRRAAGDRAAAARRLQSMMEIVSEQESISPKSVACEELAGVLCALMCEGARDIGALTARRARMRRELGALRGEVGEARGRREAVLEEHKRSIIKDLVAHVWDGSSGQPRRCGRTLAASAHALRAAAARADDMVQRTGDRFQTAKSAESTPRKLWQWFLTDPARLHAALEH